MATVKRRIPVTLPENLEVFLERFAKAHNLSLSQSMVLLLQEAEEWLEDKYFGGLADTLDEKTTSFESHDTFWDAVLTEKK